MSMYYDLICTDCKETLPVFRNGRVCDANEDDIYNFIIEHQEHNILLLDEHKSLELKLSKEAYIKGYLIGSGT